MLAFGKLLFNKYRILAVDGTHVPLSKNLVNDGFINERSSLPSELTPNKTYVNSLISGLYDVYNNTIVDLNISSSNSERKTYMQQFDYLQTNDIIIHDRGYYSDKLLYELNELQVFPIFRMKKNLLIVKNFPRRVTNFVC